MQEALLAAAVDLAGGRAAREPAGLAGAGRLPPPGRALPRDDARRRREDGSWPTPTAPDAAAGQDDSLVLLFMCCHPSLTPASAIPLTLRAVGGLTTREIAAAFFVPEATMAQRISRAKARSRPREPFAPPDAEDLPTGCGRCSGSSTSCSPKDRRAQRARPRPPRPHRGGDPPHPRCADDLGGRPGGRGPARADAADRRPPSAPHRPDGALVPLEEQDRAALGPGDRAEGVALITDALRKHQMGEYQVQAAIAAVHDQAPATGTRTGRRSRRSTAMLEKMTGSPVVRLNRAVAVAMVDGPAAGLALLDGLEDDLGDHHRLQPLARPPARAGRRPGAALVEYRADGARAEPAGAGPPHDPGRPPGVAEDFRMMSKPPVGSDVPGDAPRVRS